MQPESTVVKPMRARRRLGRLVLAAVAIELALLALERLLVHALGQEPIAAAMLSVPTSRTALLGAAAVLARISAHALFPALAIGTVVALGVVACCAPPGREGGRHPRPGLDARRALTARWTTSRSGRRREMDP